MPDPQPEQAPATGWRRWVTRRGLVFAAGWLIAFLLLLGPGLEPIFVARARAAPGQEWSRRWLRTCAWILAKTGRTEQAIAIYENELYWPYRGDERCSPVLTGLAERLFETEADREAWARFLPWTSGTFPEWSGVTGAPPDPALALDLLELYDLHVERRDYVKTRWISRTLQACVDCGLFADPDVVTRIRERYLLDHSGPRRY